MYIIIVGAGKVGEYLAITTLKAGNEVVVIENDPIRADELATTMPGNALVIQGDGCDSHYLEDASVGRADIFVAATGRDDDNLVACEIASRVYDVPRCIARVNNPKNVRIFRKLGIESVSSTTLIARLIEEEATLGSMNATASLQQGNISLIEVPVNMHNHDLVEGLTVEELRLPEGSLLIAVVKEDGPILAEPSISIHTGDALVVAVETDSIRDVRAAIKGL